MDYKQDMTFSYDKEFDILYINYNKRFSYGDEKDNGIVEMKDMETGVVNGYMIEDFIELVKKLSEGCIEWKTN